MIAKIWKKVLFAILIDQELQSSAEYIQEKQIENGL